MYSYGKSMGDKQVFREDFITTALAVDNGATLTNATVANGVMTCADGGAEYVKDLSLFWQIGGTIRMRIRTDSTEALFYRFFTYGIDVNRSLTFSRKASDGTYLVQIRTASGDNYYSTAVTAGQSASVEEIVITWDPSTTTFILYIEKVLRGTDTTAGAVAISANTIYGTIGLGKTNLSWVGEIHSTEIYIGDIWDLQTVEDAYNNSTYSEIDASKALAWLPFRSRYNDGSLERTKNLGKGADVIVGDGSTSTTYPTFLTPHGAQTDGGDYIKSTNLSSTLTALSFVCVFKLPSYGSYCLGSYEKSGGVTGFIMLSNGSTALQFYCGGAGGTNAALFSYADVSSRSPILVAIGTGNGTTTSLYVNGAKGTNATIPATPSVDSNYVLSLFSRYSTTTQPCGSGTVIYNAMMFDYALTERQVQYLTQYLMKQINI